MEKLYMLEVVTDMGSCRRPLAYSHSVKKLSSIVVNVQWYIGTDDITNSPDVVRHTKKEGSENFPIYWIREVPFVI